ncbi:MAG: hypothetical protein EZS28_040920 [Streblomastix strix]|uniref:Uncharacterized protein n=1 Tax=Streblomastix strix TaxID=222440 RepID=A0A5J4TZD7_9EUKA|nr:MAG: hypothetical protein EZS28_040920 [Streblomastix strix]
MKLWFRSNPPVGSETYDNISNDNKNSEESKIRDDCKMILSQINMHGDEEAGGSREENQNDIHYELSFLSRFINNLHNGRSINPILLPAPSDLIKTNSEQIEEQGGLEEIEAQLTNNKGDINYINFEASKAKNSILNYFKDQTNDLYWFF